LVSQPPIAFDALNRALLAPQRPALALKGFLLAAQNQTREAIEWFDRARSRLRPGQRQLGRLTSDGDHGRREDLPIAAALDRRSVLQVTWRAATDYPRVTKNEAREGLDLNDPTAFTPLCSSSSIID
jgi:hypothetical protein